VSAISPPEIDINFCRSGNQHWPGKDYVKAKSASLKQGIRLPVKNPVCHVFIGLPYQETRPMGRQIFQILLLGRAAEKTDPAGPDRSPDPGCSVQLA
jgi:hypothetical protein